jgi:type IV pilus assembly protein PilP
VTRSLLTVLALLAWAGLACGRKPTPPPPAKTKAVAAPAEPVASAADGPKKPAEGDWSYSSVGKRDPFRSFLAEGRSGKALGVSPCSTPLGRYELEQLRLVAVITGLEDPVGMVQTPGGVGYAVRRGACIGKNGGTVSAIRSGELVVAEWAIRADGTRDRTQTVISLPKTEPMNLEEQP